MKSSKLDIAHTKALISHLTVLGVTAAELVKRGFGISSIFRIFKLFVQAAAILKEVPHVPAELSDLDEQESAELGAMSYNLVKKMIEAVVD